jgi:glycosyltransferase involved in cell wall biosynthesis
LISDNNLSESVKLHIDMPFEDLVDLMKKSKIFFHPRDGEHFGMSIVEAMSAGLIPVVPTIGGQSEFVPEQYQYRTIEEAFQLVSHLIVELSREHMKVESDRMIEIAKNFSETSYKKQFQSIISQLFYH